MTTTEPQTLSAFIAKHGLTFKTEAVDPTRKERGNWQSGSSHWAVVIKYGKKQMTVRFHQGPLCEDPPTLENVLDCVASDCSGLENSKDFDDYCKEYGLGMYTPPPQHGRQSYRDGDSIKGEIASAKELYNAVKAQSGKLKRFLGEDVYKELLWDTGRE